MNNTKVQNPEKQIPTTKSMNDRDFVNDMLATEKYLSQSYGNAMNEASNQVLYQDILHIFEDTQNCQRDLFNLMFKNGWYSLEEVSTQTSEQSYQQFQQYKQQLPTQ
ncbi:spore coat protein [Gracilibacillus sp. S3-1-1]|uniref:Spore coat protein n=1 Tax=Gracilibacillus pellucidus TaxID=3095368 RepID=A0ACC6M1D9_9BACI|nr:spore coat protein [Gracilibacillus sp. S3-1-1]MDX8044716.1 spore coat protein [Gracilibacillus sp. S3-1-1]